jgi:hypothetical protein
VSPKLYGFLHGFFGFGLLLSHSDLRGDIAILHPRVDHAPVSQDFDTVTIPVTRDVMRSIEFIVDSITNDLGALPDNVIYLLSIVSEYLPVEQAIL